MIKKEHDHTELIMMCNHVIFDHKPIGLMEESIKKETMICQNCIDIMTNTEKPSLKNLPNDVHLMCKKCILEKLNKK